MGSRLLAVALGVYAADWLVVLAGLNGGA